MKAVLAVLLAVVLCAQQADSLWCFMCEKQSSNWSCLKITKCSAADKYCLTTVGYAGIGMWTAKRQITKKCSPNCPEFNINLGLASYSTTCCNTSLCNVSGKPAPKPGPRQ
ncbi:lymphocyte antigen 6E-like [Terrapene carolina triunguis]|uniref:lymphocyte antigen 6E-like n=1 Tax=Terrapene triunguis TaxID=2587831 RepID=UPI000CEFA433|nr:lymphocyte antigen 6E-like [Terrapene carolina triunguis]